MPEFNKAIIVGDACLDIYIRIADLLVSEIKPCEYRLSLGGTCGGASLALSSLGVDTAFLGTVGYDYSGKYILNEFERLGINTELTVVDENFNTMSVFAFIDDEGERHLWGFPREKQAYAELDLNKIDLNKVKTASWLHSSGMTLLANGSIRKALPELFKIAYEAGVNTSLDLNTRVSDLSLLDKESVEAIRNTLPYVKYLTGSASDEFYSFYPCEDFKDSVRHFANENRTVIARMGKDGYMVIENGKEESSPSYDVEVINTTGAGDSFNAGFISKLLEGKDIFEACRYANAVSAYKISAFASGEALNKDAIEDFIKNNKLRKD